MCEPTVARGFSFPPMPSKPLGVAEQILLLRLRLPLPVLPPPAPPLPLSLLPSIPSASACAGFGLVWAGIYNPLSAHLGPECHDGDAVQAGLAVEQHDVAVLQVPLHNVAHLMKGGGGGQGAGGLQS